MYNQENQRTAQMTLLRKEGGWRKYQIKAIQIKLGTRRVSIHLSYPDEIVILGFVEKAEIARITNETNFCAHKIIGYNNPRLHKIKPF